MANQTGIAITVKAFLPTGKTLDEVFAALSIVKEAHATGDYSALLKAAIVEEVKTEQKTRRTEDAPQPPVTQETEIVEDFAEVPPPFEDASGLAAEFDNIPADTDEAVPEFIKNSRKKSA